MTPAPGIVLIGFMGTGKSAIGQSLARRWGAAFLDTDAEIERTSGKSVARIFADHGEADFRARETRLLETLAATPAPNKQVIATGGGTPLRPENAALLKQLGQVVWLTAPAERIAERVGPDFRLRPLLAGHQADPHRRIAELLSLRREQYVAAAQIIWDTAPFASSEDAAAALAEHLCQDTLQSPLARPRR